MCARDSKAPIHPAEFSLPWNPSGKSCELVFRPCPIHNQLFFDKLCMTRLHETPALLPHLTGLGSAELSPGRSVRSQWRDPMYSKQRGSFEPRWCISTGKRVEDGVYGRLPCSERPCLHCDQPVRHTENLRQFLLAVLIFGHEEDEQVVFKLPVSLLPCERGQ